MFKGDTLVEVVYAKFHQPLWTPILGVVGESLPSPSKSFKVKMFHTPTGLLIETTGPKSAFVVPHANIVCMELAPPKPETNG